jgi:hypothetical protein
VGTRSKFITWQAKTNRIYSPELLPLADAKAGFIAPAPLTE